jgi:hypothetical protein
VYHYIAIFFGPTADSRMFHLLNSYRFYAPAATHLRRPTSPYRRRALVSGIVLCCTLVACSDDDPQPTDGTPMPGATPVMPANPTDPGTPTDPTTPGSPTDPVTPGADPAVELPALPSPPLTDPPSAASEPVAESPDLNTAIGFQPVANTGEPLPAVIVEDLTEADFAAGTPEPVITIPADVDPATNTAPYFEGIENQEVVAGELLEIVYRPIDDDGGIPGMFPNALPRGGSFDDNFNGSKTFRWIPLQEDVGIREFAVTAIDTQNTGYRTTQNIRLKIVLPDDTSGIPNEAPILDRLPDFAYTARVGDPVVVEMNGVDRNGTTPVVEIPDPPAGALFNAHPQREGVFVLKFVPAAAGNLNLQVLLRDELDATLVTSEIFTINVVDQNYPPRTGSRLKALAAGQSRLFGYASSQDFYQRPDGALYADIAASEFDFVTPESSMKMALINPLPGRYDFADTDNLIAFARQHSMQVHGHPLVWYRQNPLWIENAPLADLQGHMQEHIDRLINRIKRMSRCGMW